MSSFRSALKLAELEFLNYAARGMVIVAPAIYQIKRGAKHLPETGRIVPNNRQAATTLRTIQGKRSNDDMPALFDGILDTFGVGRLIARVG